jgi:hypothetical protein
VKHVVLRLRPSHAVWLSAWTSNIKFVTAVGCQSRSQCSIRPPVSSGQTDHFSRVWAPLFQLISSTFQRQNTQHNHLVERHRAISQNPLFIYNLSQKRQRALTATLDTAATLPHFSFSTNKSKSIINILPTIGTSGPISQQINNQKIRLDYHKL